MKQISFLLLVLLGFSACQKGSTLVNDQGCIREIVRSHVSGADSLAAVSLFKKNKLSPADFVFERVILNDTISNTQGTSIYQHIFAIQLLGGLPVLSDDIGYHFLNGVLQSVNGNIYGAQPQNAPSVVSLAQLRNLFLIQVNQNDRYLGSMKDSCLVAEHGYYNLNVGTGETTPNLVRAWLVTPAHLTYPQAMLRDDNTGTLIYYSDGILTLNRSH